MSEAKQKTEKVYSFCKKYPRGEGFFSGSLTTSAAEVVRLPQLLLFLLCYMLYATRSMLYVIRYMLHVFPLFKFFGFSFCSFNHKFDCFIHILFLYFNLWILRLKYPINFIDKRLTDHRNLIEIKKDDSKLI